MKYDFKSLMECSLNKFTNIYFILFKPVQNLQKGLVIYTICIP